MQPVLVINFKAYPSATGAAAVALARACALVAEETGVDVRVCVQAADLFRVADAVRIPVLAQHVDDALPGQHTGFVVPEDVKAEGAVGTLLNHSEHQLPDEVLARTVERCKEVGLDVIICANTPEKGAAVARFAPSFVAVEPPELIGGGVSVSSAQPGLISSAVELIHAPVLVGAGVHTGEDVRVALERGAAGVLVASGVTQAADPAAALRALASGFAR